MNSKIYRCFNQMNSKSKVFQNFQVSIKNFNQILGLFLDLSIVGRLMKEWDILQFSFASEHLDIYRNSLVQV